MDRRTFLQRAAVVGLTVGGPAWQRALAAPVEAAEVRGSVVTTKRPLAGVRVSDGYHVVTTDASGDFRIPVGPHSGPFLSVTTPRGYWTDRFYIPTATAAKQRPVFQLQPVQTGDDYTALYITDIHLGDNQLQESIQRLSATIDEINALDPLPAFCWMGGDISLQRGLGDKYVEMTSRLKIPVRNAVGNHEMLIDKPDPRGRFQQLFGPTYYSFDFGKVHYVTLDGCVVNTNKAGYKNVEGLLSPRELHWLAEDLKRVPAGMSTVVAIHIPLVTEYPERRGTTAEKSPHWVIQNAAEVVELLSQHSTSLVLQGHLHENERLTSKGLEFVESVSVCGTWWTAKTGQRENCVSGEPRGYRVLGVHGDRVQHRYQSSAESRVDAVGEIVGLPKRRPAGKDAALQVNIFDGCAATTVLARIDDRTAIPLQPSPKHQHYANLNAAHHWQWSLPGSAFTPGKHHLHVRVEEPGRPVEEFEHDIIAES